MLDIGRREFVTLLGGAAASPIAARAQVRLPIVAFLVAANPEPFWTEFRNGLGDYGYVEGRNIQFVVRSAEGRLDRLRSLADDLVRLKVEIIIATLTPAVIAARQATTEIPIIMVAGDPVALGLVSSLPRPGGNITGLSSTGLDVGAKTVEIIRDVLPATRHVGVLANAPDPYSRPFVEQIEEGGRALGVAIQVIKVRGEDEFAAAFASFVTERADAVIVQPSLPRKPVINLALKHRLPLVGGGRAVVEDGALLSYGANLSDLYHRMTYFVDRVLKGAKPADLPVEQPTRYELAVNLKTANVLGIKVPDTVLARADAVIE
jgi:putative tryptophan/tyrosine transport system substrate-binding protein